MTRELRHELFERMLAADRIPTTHLKAISDYVGLPWEIRPVGTDHLASAIRAALYEARNLQSDGEEDKS